MRLALTVAELCGEHAHEIADVGGGCISSAGQWRTTSGRRLFVKHNANAPADMFAAEAKGLEALGAVEGGCRVPGVVGVSEQVLVLEWVEFGRGPFGEALGRGLAAQHRVTADTHGNDYDNYIGATEQPNPRVDGWIDFFTTHRLGFQWELLRRRGKSSRPLDQVLDRLLPRLSDLLVEERPALLHGDLWTGNASATADGDAVIFDPAAYFGHREADLAMTELFGSFGARFFAAYHEAFPIDPGYRDRKDLYNLYHVLNHANLFGGGYAGQALSIARRYV